MNENPDYWNLDESPGYLRIYNSNAGTGYQNLLLRTVGMGFGVDIEANGAVTIKQVGGWGVQNAWAEGNVFSNNSREGLIVFSNGPVSVAFFQAKDNGFGGIYIDASHGSGAVMVSGMNNNWQNLVGNNHDGLVVLAKGNITISKVQGSNNGVTGGGFDNSNGTGNVTLTDAWFDGNGWYGLAVNTNGAVSWTNGSASGNFKYGANIIDLGLGKAVTIKNVTANNNGETGIYVESKGVVTITESEGNNNSANYYTIDYGEWWSDNLNYDQVWFFNGEQDDHVFIELFSSGRFTPSMGIYDPEGNLVDWIDGTSGSVSYDFTLPADGQYEIHVGTDNNDCNCWRYDLKLYEGTVPDPWTSISNSANGFYVDNHNGTGAVTITNTYNRWNGNNSGSNIYILSSGAVTLTGMDLNDGARGLFINNTFAVSGAPGVTLTKVNAYNNNWNALEIQSKGAVVVKTADLSGNWGAGYNVVNTYGATSSPMTFTDVNVNSSNDQGLYLRSNGAVTLTNVTSNGNLNTGIDIITPGAVKITNGGANGNRSDGISIVAGGAISLTNIYTGDNGQRDGDGNPLMDAYGIYLENTNLLGIAPVTLTNLTSSHNTLDGLYIDTTGAVTINTLTTNDNTDWGLRLDQTDAPDSLKPITLNLATAINNGMDGIYVDARGSITANTFVAHFNHSGSGVFFDNRSGTGSVTVLNTLGKKLNLTVANGSSGVAIYSNGAVTITQLESLSNTVDGLDVDNSTSTALVKPVVNLSNIITRYNTQVGIYVHSLGVTTISNSWSISNSWDGIKSGS